MGERTCATVRCLTSAVAVLLVGCTATGSALVAVDDALADRVGHGIARTVAQPAFEVPPGVTLDDGLDEDEAVALALWNNAQFRAALADLGVAEADVVESGLLRNPVLSVLFPVGAKQLEATLAWGVEALWERPQRMKAAEIQLESVGERLVQFGLDTARDARVAFAEAVLARQLTHLTDGIVHVLREVTELAAARLAVGDESPLGVATARLELAAARDEHARVARQADAARARLRQVLGLDASVSDVAVTAPPPVLHEPRDLPTLLEEALVARPDVRAAELRVEEVGARLEWERTRVLQATALVDVNAAGSSGFEAGPGLQVEVPIFNRNQGGIAKGEAEIERASWQYRAVRSQVVSEVEEARSAHIRARARYVTWRNEARPIVAERLAIAERACAAGQESYLTVLEARRRDLEVRRREDEAAADLRRTAAELDRSVGRRLDVE